MEPPAPPPPAPSPAQIGEILGGYLVEEVIGQGGMGSVYRATHERLGRRAALKVLATELASDTQFVSRFFEEAKLVNDIRHPNIIDIFDFIEQAEPRRVAYVMELLAGSTLTAVMKQRRLRLKQAVNACYQLANALEAVHQVGAVHRDLKPDNIFVVADLESDLELVPSVKILDFGIAKSARPDAQHKTKTGMILGTPSYMAPEQVTAEPVSPATDVYALGEVFFEMVAGRRVFAGETSAILRSKLLGDQFDLSLEGVRASRQIQDLVRACLTLEADKRPSITVFKERLLQILEADARGPSVTNMAFDATLARASSMLPKTPRSRRVGAIVGAVLLTAAAGAALFLSRPEDEPQIEALAAPPPPPPPPPPAVKVEPPPPPPRPVLDKPEPKPEPKVEAEPRERELEATPKPKKRPRSNNNDDFGSFGDALRDAADRLTSELDVESADAYARRGDEALRASEWKRAKRLYEACLGKKQHPGCHRGLGYVYIAEGNKTRAREHFKRYLELRPNAADEAKVRKLMN